MRWLAIPLLFLVAGCTQLREWAAGQAEQAAIEYIDGPGKERVETFVKEKVGDEFGEWKARADTDKSGDTSWGEWKAWILGGGGGGLLTILMALLRKMKGQETALEAVSAKQSKKRGEQWQAHGALEDKVRALESRLSRSSS